MNTVSDDDADRTGKSKENLTTSLACFALVNYQKAHYSEVGSASDPGSRRVHRSAAGVVTAVSP